jgi:hypothetical protein
MIREERRSQGGLSSVIMEMLGGSKKISRATGQRMAVAVVNRAKGGGRWCCAGNSQACYVDERAGETRDDKRAKQRTASLGREAER